jgi:glyoxylase-like metal-dependent hydrolase (beta-lactamase superfamily II)
MMLTVAGALAVVGCAPSAAETTSSGPVPQMPDLTGVEIITHPVAGNVYMLEATKDVAGNIGVSVGPDGILIIDDQFAPLTDQISAALAELSGGELRFILNTHYHEDHADGNEILSRDGAVIVAHTNTRKRLLHRPKGHWPVITFDHEASVHFNGEEIKATWYPGGHTDSDLIFFFTESNVLHLGDLWNSGTSSFPVVDIEAGGNAMRILENIEKLIPTVPEDARIIPGHGPVSDLAELRSYRDMLEETIELVRNKWEAGMSLERIQTEGLQPKYDSWGWGYLDADGWIEGIVKSLEAAREGDLDGS